MALEEIRNTKIKKVEELRKAGMDPYPASSGRTNTISEIIENFDKYAQEKNGLVLAGRVMAKREHGGSMFFDLRDASGKFQGFIKEDIVGKDNFTKFSELIDIGDFIEITGTLFKTKKDEKTLETLNFKLLTKALLPLPEKWHGLQDTEERLRKRYLDLIMNPNEKGLFIKKNIFWQKVRSFLAERGGLEVETPILEKIPGGADAEPFTTHFNALDIDLYLRISLEFNLKRLIVAGYEKVFEIGRIFRNEGIDREHLQDYTQMEMYWAYTDYKQLMDVVKSMCLETIGAVNGSLSHKYQEINVDWSGEWKTYDYYKVFKKNTGLDLTDIFEKDLKKYAENEGIDIKKHIGKGRLIDVIFKKKVKSQLIEPGFLVLPPVEIEPLAKRWPKDRNRVERFQVMAGGTELGKGFSELNDPMDQRKRLEEQVKLREKGDKEAHRMDDDFLEALEYGMPPTAGFGMSERFFAFITDKPVRETVFFPLMRSK
ncbi:MAG: lysine--tRNA ligase [Candidatus Yanofskybacteria bacterium RIFCSPHIGHO2_01_FULL_39_8b]|uniref:Lysine--tRNA ligase n=1 Tax=Candidatus Yanofskybacteria bacterium RIFCSPHIGHO2_01_FULL_39_8b TaxID=1802659 RepID=A0A1F8EGD9_9BACT|nr:MAG: lysine--tRNA ligase [Candidatus Yanofskybacteria bacterium RIFCSPHIGHO2_01_FULL_39_8b]